MCRYFSDFWNYVDYLSFILLAVYLMAIHGSSYTETDQIMGSLILILVLYRSFSFLRVFDSFTTLIGMINTILQKLVAFVIILVYFFLATGALLIFLNPEGSYKENMANAYVFSLFGGIEGSDFDSFSYAGIAIVFGTAMVTIVLLNILIAFLSNVFSRLEDQQKSNDIKEKAQMILDFEIVPYFFREFFRRKTKWKLVSGKEIGEHPHLESEINETVREGVRKLIEGER
jgi:hypothetical protein